MSGKTIATYRSARAGIDDDVIIGDNLVMSVPSWETLPVITASKAVVAIYGFYLFIVRSEGQGIDYLLSVFFSKPSCSTIFSALSPRFILCSMALPT